MYASEYRCRKRGGDARPKNFAEFHTENQELLNEDAWLQYYSRAYLVQTASRNFWRLPNLRCLPDADDQRSLSREKSTCHPTRLLFWAYNVACTHTRQPILSTESIIALALSTLRRTLDRQQELQDCKIEPYSETQARFWLHYFGVYEVTRKARARYTFARYSVSDSIASGGADVLGWQKYYTPQRWSSDEARAVYMDPDSDGADYRPLIWQDPLGGPQVLESRRGWTPEVGSEEEVEFLAAVAIEELKQLEESTWQSQLNYIHRSHILLGVLHIALQGGQNQRASCIAVLKREILAAGRLNDEAQAEDWIKQALKVMDPYVHELGTGLDRASISCEEQLKLLHHILKENGQLFGRYRIASKKSFGLKPGIARRSEEELPNEE